MKRGIFTVLEDWAWEGRNPILGGFLFLLILSLDLILIPIEIIQETFWMIKEWLTK